MEPLEPMSSDLYLDCDMDTCTLTLEVKHAIRLICKLKLAMLIRQQPAVEMGKDKTRLGVRILKDNDILLVK